MQKKDLSPGIVLTIVNLLTFYFCSAYFGIYASLFNTFIGLLFERIASHNSPNLVFMPCKALA